MAEQQVIRIRMRDRPGALSQICTALAAHGVDIIHLDVVSAHDGEVVDDLALSGKEPGDIARAVRGFLPDVVVSPLPGGTTEPVFEFGSALLRLAAISDQEAALTEFATGAGQFVRANQSLFLRIKHGSNRIFSSLAGIPEIEATEPCAARVIFSPATVVTFSGASDWAPAPFRAPLGAEHIALAPVGTLGVVVLARQGDIPFTQGELRRLGLYTKAATALMPFTAASEVPLAGPGALPPGAISEPL